MTGFDKEKAAFTVDGSESGRREQVPNDLESGSSISKPGLRVKGAAERRALDEARAGRLAEVVRGALVDMPMERGGSAVLRGEETRGTGKRWYVCVTGESPMTEQAAARVVKSVLELAAEALRGLSPEEREAAAKAVRLAAESFPLWRLVYGEEPGGGTPPGGGE